MRKNFKRILITFENVPWQNCFNNQRGFISWLGVETINLKAAHSKTQLNERVNWLISCALAMERSRDYEKEI